MYSLKEITERYHKSQQTDVDKIKSACDFDYDKINELKVEIINLLEHKKESALTKYIALDFINCMSSLKALVESIEDKQEVVKKERNL